MNKTNMSLKLKRFFSFSAFIAIILIAIALIMQAIFKDSNPQVFTVLRIIGESIAYLIACITAFSYIRTKTSPVWAIVYAICVTVIVVMVVLAR